MEVAAVRVTVPRIEMKWEASERQPYATSHQGQGFSHLEKQVRYA